MILLDILNRIESTLEPNYTELLLNGLHSDFLEQAINKASFEVFLEFFKEFEQNQFTKFGISNLVKSNQLINVSSDTSIVTHPNSILYDISDMYFTISNYMSVDGKIVSVKPISHDYYHTDNLNNPLKNPHIDSGFWRLDIGNSNNSNIYREVIMDTSSYNISSKQYYVSYIKIPSKVSMSNVNSGIDINDEIIDKFIIPLIISFIVQKYSPNRENNNENNEKNK